MVELLQETRVSLTQLAREQGVYMPTVWRWAMKGARGVKLETMQIGGRRYTTQEAFQRFVERGTAAANGGSVTSATRTNRQRKAAIDHANAELDAAGI